MPILEVKELVSGYSKINILHGVSLQINQKEIVSIIGPNGAGKSTLMKTIFGLVKVFSGVIFYNKKEITGFTPAKLVHLGLGYVPQSYNVFPSLTIKENLEMGAFTRKDNYSESLKEVFRIFPFLKNNLEKKAGNLSGGQQKMLSIGMALMLNPKILLLDEPSAGLAPNLVEELMKKIELINKAGTAILMVEQNARRALAISHRGYVLAMGRNEFSDRGEILLNNPEIARLYLGH